ncbi:hypothetical protein H310_10692 [Aphanomyces invadans]|uniref:Uncharacterized protein n=1 Tax=Aphanomyces invadans TaxID=157072 RepID=A0A024TPW7_9STRA|nr:hypothetical protein H310_10692 [Aphanomyces invadans]ETV96044.1 hypothetical protein H310_10692 [Aphanomyces invadans]|eukprot:XP_008875355.1 hypothetical protein H310_10692 [Aphanomyces invadans]
MVSDIAATSLPSLPTSPAPSSRRSGQRAMNSSNSSRSSISSYDMSSLPTPRSSGAPYDAHDSLDDDSCTAPMANNGEFYDEVESFLSRPSPSLGKIAKGSKSTENLLPVLKAERSKLRGAEGHRPDLPISSSGYGRSVPEKGKKKAPVDLSLVQQAFAYANELRAQELQENDTLDDASDAISKHVARHTKFTDRPSRDHVQKPPQKTKPSKSKPTPKTTSAIYGVPEKPTAPPKAKAGPDWDSCSKEVSTAGHNGSSMDPQLMQQLLSNFQNGTTLNELRQELAASQASLKESRQVLQGAAKTFFLKGAVAR